MHLFLLFLLLLSALLHCVPITPFVRKCGTRDYNLDKQVDFQHEAEISDLLKNSDLLKSSDEMGVDNDDTSILIPIYWHVINALTTTNGKLTRNVTGNLTHDHLTPTVIGNLTREKVAESVNALNKDYAMTHTFQFVLKSVDYTTNTTWFRIDTEDKQVEMEMKVPLRHGNKASLNIYSADLQDGVLGYSTFPQDYDTSPSVDGVVIHYETLPGGSYVPMNQGKTLTHEVGHWLGLYHTFNGGCTFPNDFVDDTRPQLYPSSGCPGIQRSCKLSYFNDMKQKDLFIAIDKIIPNDMTHNFLDYSDDACLSEFTQGQIDRMKAQWIIRLD